MKHTDNTLASEPRVYLRPLADSDAEAIFDYWREPRVSCFAEMKMNSLDDALTYIGAEENGEKDPHHLAVCLKDGDALIGDVSAAFDNSDTCSVVWCLNPRYEGKGLAYEAAREYISYLFEKAGARRIYAYVEEDNVRSRRLCERLGMRLEGCMKEFISFVKNPDGTPHYENTCLYALLKKEWEAASPTPR